jgi:hypothetical protein
MRVLVACEESQAVTLAFRRRGHEAFSADLQACSGGHPEWHIQGDATALLDDGWDLLIAHPPCTYLSNAGAVHLFGGGRFNDERYRNGLEAKGLFMAFFDAPIQRRVIENPTPSTVYELPRYDQVIQPFHYGHPMQKRTCLWIRGLPHLVATENLGTGESSKVPGNWYNAGGKDRQKNRSKTFPGIAEAMAAQWGDGELPAHGPLFQ